MNASNTTPTLAPVYRETLARDFAVHIGKTKAPVAARKRTHDLPWLRRTLRTLRTVPRGRLRRMF